MSTLAWVGVLLFCTLSLGVCFLVSLRNANAPISYPVNSFVDLQRFFSAWSALLDERADIFVGFSEVPELIQFRKNRFKSRPDELVYRFRNADRTRQFFDTVNSGLLAQDIEFEIEVTKKRKRPRAAIVRLEAEDLFVASAASHLCRATFQALGRSESGGIVVHASGRLRNDVALSALSEYPTTRADLGLYGFSGFVLSVFRSFSRPGKQ